MTIRSRHEIFRSLIQGAKDTGDADKLRLTRRRACDALINGRDRTSTASADARLSQARQDDQCGQPQGIRALNCIEDANGSGRQFSDSNVLQAKLSAMKPAGYA